MKSCLPLNALSLGMLSALVAGCAMSPEAESAAAEEAALNPILSAEPIGPPRSCLNSRLVRSTEGVSDRVILFRTVGGELYRNELPNRCPGAGRDEAFSYRTTISSICRAEIIRFFDPVSGVSFGSCSLGEFVPIAEDADEMVEAN